MSECDDCRAAVQKEQSSLEKQNHLHVNFMTKVEKF